MRDLGDRLHVGEGAAAVGHVGQADQRGVLVHRGSYLVGVQALVDVGGQHAQLHAALSRDSLDHVTVAGEVVLVGDDHVPARAGIERCRGQFVQVHRGVVGHQHLARRGAGQLADQVTRTLGQVHPVIPRPGERGAPLLADDGLQPPQRGQRERAERVAVQVDQGRVVKREPVAEPGQRIRRVKFLGVRPLQEHLGHTAHDNSQATAPVPRGGRYRRAVAAPRGGRAIPRFPPLARERSGAQCGSLPSARGSVGRTAEAALRPEPDCRSPPASPRRPRSGRALLRRPPACLTSLLATATVRD